jgi:hydrogenase expression/formation protein HypE
VRAGVKESDVARAAAMLREPGISVVSDAIGVCEAVRPTMMHDPTEGGLSTALYELAGAADATLRIDPEAIHVFDETRIVCGALGLDAMGLLASGALLCVVARGEAEGAISALEGVKIASRVIGTVERGPARVIIGAEDSTTPLARFARDEIARYYETVRA